MAGTLAVALAIENSTHPCLVPSIDLNARNGFNPANPTWDLYSATGVSPEATRLVALTTFSENILPIGIPDYVTCGPNCTFTVSFYAPALKCAKARPSNETWPELNEVSSLLNTSTDYTAHMDNGDLWLAWVQSIPEAVVDGQPYRWVMFGNSFTEFDPDGYKAYISKCVHCSSTYTIKMDVGLSQMNVADVSYKLHEPYNNSLRADNATYLTQSQVSGPLRIPIPFEQFRAFGLLNTLYAYVLAGYLSEGSFPGSFSLDEQSSIASTKLTEPWLISDLGGNHTVQLPVADLDSKVEELYRNISASILARPYFVGSNITTNCTSMRLKNLYSYDAKGLWMSYGAGLAVSGIAVAVGIACLLRNGIPRDAMFTSIVISTRDRRLDEIITGIPSHTVRNELSRVKLKFDGKFEVQ